MAVAVEYAPEAMQEQGFPRPTALDLVRRVAGYRAHGLGTTGAPFHQAEDLGRAAARGDTSMSSSPARRWSSRFGGGLAGGSLVLLLFGWLATGTLAMYAVVSSIAVVWPPCGYLVNTDHGNFVGTFLMLDGAPRATWEWSVVLRRTLLPAARVARG